MCLKPFGSGSNAQLKYRPVNNVLEGMEFDLNGQITDNLSVAG